MIGPLVDRRVALLDGGDDRERIDVRVVRVDGRVRCDGDHRARVSGPVKLDAVRIAAPRRHVAPAEVEERPVVAEHLLDTLGPLDVVAVIDFDPVEIDPVVDARSRRVGIEADVGEVPDALGEARVVELKIAVLVAAAHGAEDRRHARVFERRDRRGRRKRKHPEVAESLAVGRDLDSRDREQLGPEIERLDRRSVVADDVVLGRHREVDPGRGEGEDAIFRRDRRVEARARVHVQIAPEHARRRNDVPRRQLHLRRAPWGDVDQLGVDAPLDALGRGDPVAARGQGVLT